MRAISSVLILSFALAGCSWFDKKANPPLTGDRKAILQNADESTAENSETPKLSEPTAVTAWPQSNGTAAQTGVHANFTPKFEKIWQTSIGEGQHDRMKFTARPVAADGKIFAMDVYGYVTALDSDSGKKLWRVRTRRGYDKALAGGMAVNGQTLYVTNGLPEVLALNVQNGARVWLADLDAPARAAPTVLNDKVYVVTRSDESFALAADTGKMIWQHHGLQELAGVIAGGAPAADADLVVMPYASGEVIALSPGNGSVLWGESLMAARTENNLATLHDLRAPPMILRDRVIAANFAANTSAIERRLGDRVWGQDFGALQPMTVSGDTVFAITVNGQLLAISTDTGNKFWSKPLAPPQKDEDEKPKYWFGPLLLNNQLLVMSSDGGAQLRDAVTGEIVKTFADLPDPAENPIVMNDTLYYVTAAGDVAAFK